MHNQTQKPLFIGFNWKVNPTSLDDAKTLFETYKKLNLDTGNSFESAIFVPDLYISSLINQGVNVGPQNISANLNGAFTGDTSAKMYKNMGCKYAIVGHSETRKELNLSSQTLSKKVQMAISESIIPIYCIAFTDVNFAEKQLTDDLNQVFNDINQNDKIVVAFEPLDSIGGVAMSNENIDHYLSLIKSFIKEKNFVDVPVLYGGGVNSTNITEILKCKNVDGFLVGGASLKSAELEKMFKIASDR